MNLIGLKGTRFLSLIALFIGSVSATAQVSESQVKAALAKFERPTNNALLVHSFLSGSDLHFDTNGAPLNNPPHGLWTTDGWVVVEKATFKKDVLVVKVRRLSVFFKEHQLRMSNSPKREVVLSFPVPPDEPTLRHMLDAVFVRADEPLINLVPGIWNDYLKRGDLPIQQPPTKDGEKFVTDLGESVYRAGNGVTPPSALVARDPDYSAVAKAANYQGIVVLSAIVGEDGLARSIRIARPLGMGLDESAIAAVETWRFKPASKDGQPVPVQINIEINFRLY